MSAARILHFGEDAYYRLEVLKLAGYETNLCSSELELVEQVEAVAPAAVLCFRVPAKLQELRSQTKIPFVTFGGSRASARAESFDLIIEPVTKPDVWLAQLSEIVQRSRELRESSDLIRSQSRQLRSASESLRRESEAVRKESANVQQELRNTLPKYRRPRGTGH